MEKRCNGLICCLVKIVMKVLLYKFKYYNFLAVLTDQAQHYHLLVFKLALFIWKLRLNQLGFVMVRKFCNWFWSLNLYSNLKLVFMLTISMKSGFLSIFEAWDGVFLMEVLIIKAARISEAWPYLATLSYNEYNAKIYSPECFFLQIRWFYHLEL